MATEISHSATFWNIVASYIVFPEYLAKLFRTDILQSTIKHDTDKFKENWKNKCRERSQKRDKEATLKSKQNENKENNIKHKKAKLNPKLKKRVHKKQNKCKTKQDRIKTKKKNKIVRREQVNLLLYGPYWPYFKQKQKTGFF